MQIQRPFHATRIVWIMTIPFIVLGCSRTPPDSRDPVTKPVYTAGDSIRGKSLYEENCSQCHKLKLGSNHKGPQLIGIYGAPAAALSDYKYSEAMANSNLTWDAKTLDTYIADPLEMMPDTRMQADPIPDVTDRQDIIAYLSTLGRAEPKATQPEAIGSEEATEPKSDQPIETEPVSEN